MSKLLAKQAQKIESFSKEREEINEVSGSFKSQGARRSKNTYYLNPDISEIISSLAIKSQKKLRTNRKLQSTIIEVAIEFLLNSRSEAIILDMVEEQARKRALDLL